MIELNLREINKIVQGNILKEAPINSYYMGSSINSKKIKDDYIFFSFKSEKVDVSAYVKEASKSGATLCIVEDKNINIEDIPNYTTVLLVDSTLIAIQQIAKYYREKQQFKVIGITGSTGKTTTKDIIASTLSVKYNVYKTEGNLNNHIGLPLSILNVDNSVDVAVLELGISMPDEMELLSDIAKPDIAVITNIGHSHLEHLKTRENILFEKLKITNNFSKNNNNVLIVNGDNDLLGELKSEKFNIMKIGIEKQDFNLIASNIILNKYNIEYDAIDDYKLNNHFVVDSVGKHNVYNSMLAIVCGRILGLYYDEIKEGLEKINKTTMRLEEIEKEFLIINDCYNASPDSMESSLSYLKTKKAKRKIAVLGDMNELGTESYNLHKKVGETVSNLGIDFLFTTGRYSKAYREGLCNKNVFCFETKEELTHYLVSFLNKDDAVLVKASRSLKFEDIVEALKISN